MGKKRKTASKNQQSGGGDNGASAAVFKPRFESFPLHLLPPSNGKGKNGSTFKVQELHPGRVWVIPNFFSAKECQHWVNFCESSGGFEYTAHPADQFIAHRECFRMQQHNAMELATRIFERLKGSNKHGQDIDSPLHRIQQESSDLYDSSKRVPIGCNPNLRVYKYTKGHSFGKHVDGSNVIGKEAAGGTTLEGC